MGILTGSDMSLQIELVKYLKDSGFMGEGIVDKRTLIVKSHYPANVTSSTFTAEKAILVVRNPLDVMVSLFNFTCSKSHDKSISDLDFQNHYPLWREFI
jgi:hypothetical protein